jgi:alpha-L-fucosidase
MIRKIIWGIMFSSLLIGTSYAQTLAPKPFGPVPNENQMKWQEMEYYAFLHFSLNTFTDQEWGNGDEDVKLFNPKDLDCRQWARVCKEAGMKGIIMVVKHHCGFCLWPSKYTEFSVKNSPWKDGKGDVVRELADACKEYGLKLGIYLSPWDRNSSDYGKPEYITYFRNQLTELLTNYGPIFEIWFDGANGGSGYYGGARETRRIDRRTYYDWQNTYKLIRKLQPDIVIWNDGGDRGDLRWVGTESGYVGETNWSLLNATGDVPEVMLRYGVENGDSWVPGEVNTSIRPGWFYHTYEDNRVKTLPQLMNTYYSSIGRNATLLLNFPIDTRGLINENDVKASKDFAAAVKEAFAVNLAEKAKVSASNVRGNSKEFSAEKTIDGNNDTYWATDDGLTNASLTIDFRKATTFNRFLVQEYIRLGQRVKAFTVEALVDGNWKELAKATTIGYKRILLFPTVKATRLRFNITDSKACPVISNIGIYNAPQILTAPSIVRNKAGEITITPADTVGIRPLPVRKVRTELGITQQPNEKLNWLIEARFGMFIHWGLYSGVGKGEWYMENSGTPPEEYRKLAYPQSGDQYFDASQFNANDWAKLAKDAGMKYMNMVAQHHDGYALFDAKYMDAFCSKQTHNRDFVREYVDACRANGLKVGIYKTLINWRYPGYYDVTGTDCKSSRFGYKTDIAHKENARLMKEEMYCLTKELLTRYGKIDQIFWDGGWLAQQGSDADAGYFWESGKYLDPDNDWKVNPYFQDIDSATRKPLGLMGMVRKYQPDCIVNPRSGWYGDYKTEEGSSAITGQIRTEEIYEKEMTMSSVWGYTPMHDDPAKVISADGVKRMLVDCTIRNMALLLNVAPDRHGKISKTETDVLLKTGKWLQQTGEAIYGTYGGPWQPKDGQYGYAYKNNTIYLFLLEDFKGTIFTLPSINKGQKVLKAYMVDTRKQIKAQQNSDREITLSDIDKPANQISIIAIELNKKIIEQ